jgi:glucose/arabinose dehydrogenase
MFAAALVGAAGVLMAATLAGATPPARSHLLTTSIPFPIAISSTSADPQHIYVCAREGYIFAVDKDTGEVAPDKFLDLSGHVSLDGDDGLLGLAFDPAYTTNGYFYVNYITPDGSGMVQRYRVPAGARMADPASAYTIMKYQRPPLGHQGGWIGFSPTNGYLYIASGDGDPGGTYDAANRAQTIVNEWMGKFLRIDPHSDDFPADADRNYHIPPSNPFVGVASDDEIWSYGLRNPWRASFDRQTGDLYFGDVGMTDWEEVDIEPASSAGGRNYGWPCMEGMHCAPSTACTCGAAGLTPPVYDYPHSVGQTVIGGYVYRGAAIPAYQGRYFFGDWFRAKLWSFVPGGAHGYSDLRDHSGEFTPPTTDTPIGWISSFGEDAAGELYVADIADSTVYKIVPYPCLPYIDANPESRTQPENSTVTLEVLAAGADPLTYRWRRDEFYLIDIGHVRGSQTSQLTIANANAADSGAYVCVLTSPCGTVETRPVMVSIRTCYDADFNRDNVVDVQDIFDYLNAWFAGDPATDLNGDGRSTQDIFDFLNSWFQGCQ